MFHGEGTKTSGFVAVQRLRDEQRSGQMPPAWLRDKIADEKLSGRFNTSKNNICSKCFEARSVNGSCECPPKN